MVNEFFVVGLMILHPVGISRWLLCQWEVLPKGKTQRNEMLRSGNIIAIKALS
jgi:hypothetical protein